MPQRSRSNGHVMWRRDPAYVEGRSEGPRGPLRAADMVDPQDPAYGHILRAAMRLIDFGFDPADPDIAERAVEVGRADYEKDPGVCAERYARTSAQKRYSSDALTDSEVVYYMRIGNRVKIGWSTNLASRLASINPEELMATELGGRKLENLRHREFSHLRTHGEWFRLEEPLVAHIAEVKSRADAA